MKKGISGTELVFGGLIFTTTVVLVVLIPPALLYQSLNPSEEYGNIKAQNALLTLLSVTHENKKVYEAIAENASGIPSNLNFLEAKLNKLIGKECYELNVSQRMLLSTKTQCENDLKHFANTTLVLPYQPGKLTQEIIVGLV